MVKKKKPTKRFQFKPGFSIGAIAAEQDTLLAECFVTSSSYESIIDIDDPRCGIIGRSGTGKTAIFYELKRNAQQVIEINPESLAFQFLGSSDMISALRESNITLDYFYKLLWRHVFVVEILKKRFPDESRRYGLIFQLIEHLKRTVKPDRERDRAIKYLDDWGATIIQAPQERIKTIHDTFSRRLRLRIGMIGGWAELLGVGTGIEGETENKEEVTERIRLVKEEVNQIQVQDLNAVKKYLDTEILTNPQRPYYVIIDDLDRFWVEDPLVYELIRALILEIYDWSDVDNIKIIYALRDNILSKIESEFTSRSYQREKLEAQRTRIIWTRKQLEQIIDKRLEIISRKMRVTDTPTLDDILPKKRSNTPSGKDYIFERTFLRPRDIIDFINKASEVALMNTALSFVNIHEAEIRYSKGRLQAAHDEWRENCPGIEILTQILHGSPRHFDLSWISEDDLERVFSNPKLPGEGWLYLLGQDYITRYSENKTAAIAICRRQIMKIFYEIGIIGVRTPPSLTIKYSYQAYPLLDDLELEGDLQFHIHPMFYRALDTSLY